MNINGYKEIEKLFEVSNERFKFKKIKARATANNYSLKKLFFKLNSKN